MRALTRREWIGLSAIGIGAAGAGGWLRREAPLGEDISATVDVAALANAPGYPSEGPEDAPVTMLVFSDYACGVCRKAEPLWREAVREATPGTESVRVVHRDWPVLGPASVRAARVALAAGRQGLYAPVHEILIRSGRYDEEALGQAVVVAGGDWSLIGRDLIRDAAAIDRLLARTAQDAFQLGFRGTPGYLIGPIRIEGGAGKRQFANAIERALTSARG